MTISQRATPEECGPVVGRSSWAEQTRAAIARLAASPSPVLLIGPSGTGKEHIARAIHAAGSRAPRRLLAVDARLTADCLAAAEGGTLFVEELARLNAESQAALVRALQDAADVRILAATARDPDREVAAGRLLAQLRAAFGGEVVQTIPLSQRREDVEPLAAHFLAALARRHAMPAKRLAPRAVCRLCDYDWPGNVNELETVLERAVLRAPGAVIGAEAISLPEEAPEPASALAFPETAGLLPARAEWPTLAEVQREHVLRTLAHTGGDGPEAARLLGMDWQQFQHRLNQYGLNQDIRRRPAPRWDAGRKAA